MLLTGLFPSLRLLNPLCLRCRLTVSPKCLYSVNLENKYTDAQKEKILQVINESEIDALSRYDITKARIKHFTLWKNSNGVVKTISDVEFIEGFTANTAKKLFDSILNGPQTQIQNISNKIKGQILSPNLSDIAVKNCSTVLTVYVSVNSVCWTLIFKSNYELVEWKYHSIDYPAGKKLQITDILDIAWRITRKLPHADIYVMKAEATTLRAAGSDPNNPKVIVVNLQKAQMIAMIVALLNSRGTQNSGNDETENEDILNQKIYFLRPTLPYRLYGTLVGNERVSTDQTVEMLLVDREKSPNNSHVYVPESLKAMFRSQKDLQKDMLGHCLLLSLTFMDICIYKNRERIIKLMKRDQ